MTKYLNPPEFKEALAKYKGAYAQLWLYSVSLKRLVIRLSFQGENDDLFIICVSCEHISGPFVWSNANVSFVYEISSNSDQNESNTKILDAQAKFELICSGGATMIISSDADLWKSFS